MMEMAMMQEACFLEVGHRVRRVTRLVSVQYTPAYVYTTRTIT